jgi:hypothetical protein
MVDHHRSSPLVSGRADAREPSQTNFLQLQLGAVTICQAAPIPVPSAWRALAGVRESARAHLPSRIFSPGGLQKIASYRPLPHPTESAVTFARCRPKRDGYHRMRLAGSGRSNEL